jgi:hypothetical protein
MPRTNLFHLDDPTTKGCNDPDFPLCHFTPPAVERAASPAPMTAGSPRINHFMALRATSARCHRMERRGSKGRGCQLPLQMTPDNTFWRRLDSVLLGRMCDKGQSSSILAIISKKGAAELIDVPRVIRRSHLRHGSCSEHSRDGRE